MASCMLHTTQERSIRPPAWEAISGMVRVVLWFVALYCLLDSVNLVFSFALRGAGDTMFVTLVSLHWRPVSTPLFALSVGSACAWAINFAGTRLFVFRRTVEVLKAPVPSSKPAAGGRRSVL